MNGTYRLKSVEKTKDLGERLARTLQGGEVLCFYGELGAGKTLFIQSIIHFFLPKKRVLSPTFIIVRHYEIAKKPIHVFYHLDLYRVSGEDIPTLGIVDLFHRPDTIVAIEWADRMGQYLPKKRIDIRMNRINEEERIVTIWKKN
ncbi:tRNA (adenosine(37)-N6)-threonylcarbamoyltransferase complex ATPase subunit type 1 TsaE [Candidatus Gottesmanbacteria bacterium]|nr:tRNA (adenosine(37)-N6)-threonylcarbamoyltransferase complex ATPase subunit type 1 TsaE [Candidatus Gottesmanbacteria bacterium]